MILHLLLTFSMKVDALDAARDLVETDVVETLKRCATDGSHAMIRHEEVLFPAHEQMLFLLPVLCDQVWP
jgi:iron-sulfur cluster repair protein YtfE (RIC family)